MNTPKSLFYHRSHYKSAHLSRWALFNPAQFHGALPSPLIFKVLISMVGSLVLASPAIAQGAKPMVSAKPMVNAKPIVIVQPNQNLVPEMAEGDGYLLGPGDRVKIDFFNVPEFTGEYQVLPNGTVNLPLVGGVPLQGKTLEQSSKTISTRYAAVLQRPTVTVGLLAARPLRIAIAGEVNRPGSYSVPALTPADGNVPSLTRLIQQAEGITQAADLRRVQVRRQRAYPNNGDELFTVDLWSLLQTGDIRQDLRLRDGDSIFIPATAEINLEESRQLAAANFAARNNRPLKISVVGEVNRPGPYTLIEGAVGQRDQLINPNLLQVPSVTRAIQVAGGITQSADVRNIQVRRLTRSGPPQIVKLDFWKLLREGDVLQDLALQDGDTIEIPTATQLSDRELTQLATSSFSPDKIAVNIVGEVKQPGTVSIQPNTPLNQAILAAGGFNNNRAKTKSVTLVRLNPNGTVTKRDISIDFAQGVNEQTNPALRNNDIVIVKRSGFTVFSDGLNSVLGPLNGILGVLRLFGVP
jgi:polysaccharide export outer membrane protein